MRVLVTGAAGRVGSEMAARLARHDVIGLSRAELDVSDRDRVEQVVGTVLPEGVVNCAAYTDVDGCEGDPDRARAVNALGVRHLAVACARVGAHLVHLSSDFVFPGDGDRAYDEWDEPAPRSTYGRSKLGGEREVRAHAGSWTVVRTAWVFGRRAGGFVDAVLARARAGAPFPVVTDQVGCPTYAPDLAGMLARLCVERRVGLYHVTNAGVCSRFQLARDVLELAGLDPALVRQARTEDLPAAAARPANGALDNAALRLAGLPGLRHYREALAERLGAAG